MPLEYTSQRGSSGHQMERRMRIEPRQLQDTLVTNDHQLIVSGCMPTAGQSRLHTDRWTVAAPH
ncbi:hypothetical protein AArc1_2420 [Natrarchaeobaculum sulfurireducens]|uniref:Uncharacterized protein n=1 Tax=Natrarchaeobaculum sulfurireducens TaxID=2044521 RepID=A0A346PGU0_9EURY|nr:hypothetical protein AArc1_2420 [Natrarchaeobaculum sulfurireducens]